MGLDEMKLVGDDVVGECCHEWGEVCYLLVIR
jgi:hypothetical protein